MNYRDYFTTLKKYNKLVYLDNAATTLKPYTVIKKIEESLIDMATPHRGAYKLSVNATKMYDESRNKVKDFIKAKRFEEIIFTSGTTEAINLVASSLNENHLKDKEKIILSIHSHHSNLLPWQRLAKRLNLKLEYMYSDSLEEIEKIDDKTLIVAFPMVVNATGENLDYKAIIKKARESNSLVLLDGAQAVGHKEINVEEIDCDFFTFSAHKMYGPTSIGVLYGKYEALKKLSNHYLGGDMIEYVTETSATYMDLPYRFEAGTQNVIGTSGLMECINFIEEVGLKNIINNDKLLYNYAYELLKNDPKIELHSIYQEDSSIIAFNIKGVHPHDVTTILDDNDIAIRAGHHCTQPLMAYKGLNSTCRISFALYNNLNDIDLLIEGIKKVKEIFK